MPKTKVPRYPSCRQSVMVCGKKALEALIGGFEVEGKLG